VPRPRRLSGDEVVSILACYGFVSVAQRGSHVKLQRTNEAGGRDTGTLVAIFRQACRFISESELRPHFYSP
jgi:hypothetical protein